MEYLEKNPLPPICQECIAKQKETGLFDDCYNCENALDRWEIAPADEARLQEILAKRARERKARQ